jgi:hypothetical protein
LETRFFLGLGVIRAVQHSQRRLFSDSNGHLGARGASYKKVSCYTKSLECFRLERERRRRVRLLAARSLSVFDKKAKLDKSEQRNCQTRHNK